MQLHLPTGLAIEFAEGTTLQEPELIYLPFLRAHKTTSEPTQHTLPFNRVRSVAIGVRNLAALSKAALATQQLGKLRYFAADQPLLELWFEGVNKAHLDLRPTLPLVLYADY